MYCLYCERINFLVPLDISPEYFICSMCMLNYFLNSKEICVEGSKCGENNYPELETRTCDPCNEACKGCFGSENTDCRTCADKYSLSNILSCEKIVCQSDEYLEDITFMCKSM